MLSIQNFSVTLGTQYILRDLSLLLPKGEIASLIGQSGSGKTTLFKALTAQIPSSGSIKINDTHQHPHKHVSYMMQDDLLLPWRTVIENLLLVGELGKQRQNYKQLKEDAFFFLNEVGLSTHANTYPHQLSGGMRQRVSLARALLQKKPLILLDEPFGALDALLREQMHSLLQVMRQRHAATILMITHDFRDAVTLSDRIFLLSNGTITAEWIITNEIRQSPTLQHALTSEMKAKLTSLDYDESIHFIANH